MPLRKTDKSETCKSTCICGHAPECTALWKSAKRIRDLVKELIWRERNVGTKWEKYFRGWGLNMWELCYRMTCRTLREGELDETLYVQSPAQVWRGGNKCFGLWGYIKQFVFILSPLGICWKILSQVVI